MQSFFGVIRDVCGAILKMVDTNAHIKLKIVLVLHLDS